MATVNINFRDNSNNSLFFAQFTVTTPTNQIKTELPTNFAASTSFDPAQFEMFNSTDSNSKYVTWRSVDISDQLAGAPNYLNVYPTTGLSLDIWSSAFYSAIDSNTTWNGLNGQTYSLSPTKSTVFYNYNTRTAIHHQKGGNITFTV